MILNRVIHKPKALAGLALGLLLGLAGGFNAPSAFGQAPKPERAKEPTDGFFDIPKDPNAVDEPSYGVPAYLVTSALGGMAIFIVCKSARRS
jgi:hypothetical protein